MAYTTDLVYAIYGHDKTASKALKGVGKSAESAAEQFKKMGKVASTAFLAAGAAAVGFAASAAKAAIEDEKSQKALALALKNTTHATDAQVKATEQFITKMQLTYGIADDKLRPAFATLSRATGDLTESQNLMQVAMDVSAGTGKDLESVSFALAKAHNGNFGALTRLGIPIDKNIIKSKDFNKVLQILIQTFNGSAKAGAETLAGRMALVDQHMREAKEQIGYALMPTLETMATYLTDVIVPNVQAFVDGLTGVKNSSGDAMDSIYQLGEKTRGFFKFLSDHKGFLEVMGTLIASIFIGAKAGLAVQAMISAVGLLLPAFAGVTTAAGTAAAAEAAATGGASLWVAAPAIAAIATALGITGLAAMWAGSNNEPQIQEGVIKSAIKSGKKAQKTGTGAGQFGGIDYGPYTGTGNAYGSGAGAGSNLFGNKRAVGGSVARGVSYMVGEHGPELFTPSAGGMITRTENLGRTGGVNVIVNVHGSVVQEKDLAVAVRDNIAQLMRRRGLNPAILGV